MNPYRKILDLFVGKDDDRQALMQPFFNENYVVATDAHKMVLFDKSLLQGGGYRFHAA